MIPRTPREEVMNGVIQVAERLLRRHTGHFVQPRGCRLTLEHGQGRRGIGVAHALLTLRVGIERRRSAQL